MGSPTPSRPCTATLCGLQFEQLNGLPGRVVSYNSELKLFTFLVNSSHRGKVKKVLHHAASSLNVKPCNISWNSLSPAPLTTCFSASTVAPSRATTIGGDCAPDEFKRAASTGAAARPSITVSSADGPCAPLHIIGAKLWNNATNKEFEDISLDVVVPDGGSGTKLIGGGEFRRLLDLGACRSVTPLDTSVRGIRGVTGHTSVTHWASLTLNLGGMLVHLTDLPVVEGHRGILLGNDVLGAGNCHQRYTPRSPDNPYDGYYLFTSAAGSILSEPVPFAYRRETLKRFVRQSLLAVPDDDPAELARVAEVKNRTGYGLCRTHTDLSVQAGGYVALRLTPRILTFEEESAVHGVSPVAYTDKSVEVPAWSEKDIWVRVPSCCPKGSELVLLPLDDTRAADLGVLVAAGAATVNNDGYVKIRVINPNLHKVRIPLLSPIARFIVDPVLLGLDTPFTTAEIMDKVKINPDLSPADVQLVEQMIHKVRRLFQERLGYAHGYKCVIPTSQIDSGAAPPPNRQPRNQSAEEEAALKKTLDKLLKERIIEGARSRFSSSPQLIRKPDGTFRVVLDFRDLNKYTDKDTYPLPNLEGNLAALGKANWFTTLDLLQGFHQIEVDEDSKHKTAFTTKFGQFQFARMPMGLTSSPGTFMRIVDATLRGLPPHIAIAYMDDVIIPTCGTFAEHMRDVQRVFERFIEAGFAVRCDKCYIGFREVPYLGFQVGQHGTRPLDHKVAPILSIKCEDLGFDAAAASRYCGMLGFYRKFIPHLGPALAKFDELRTKGADARAIMGSLAFKSAFAYTQNALVNVTALARPDSSKPFYIDVDAASSCGIGAVLSQRDDENDPSSHRPLAFWSRRFLSEETRYGVRDQECLALKEAVLQWRHYISGMTTIVRSDHRSLQWLLSTRHRDGSRVSGWALELQSYDITIQYVPGKIHVVPDFLSRQIPPERTDGGDLECGNPSRLPIADRLEAALPARGDENGGVPPSTSLLTIPVDETGRTQLRPRTLIQREAHRVAAVILQVQRNSECTCLLEHRGSDLQLPATLYDPNSRCDYRSQLHSYFLRVYPQALWAHIALKSAIPLKRRLGGGLTHYFIAVLPPSPTPLPESATRLVSRTSFTPLSRAQSASLTEADDFKVLRLLRATIQQGHPVRRLGSVATLICRTRAAYTIEQAWRAHLRSRTVRVCVASPTLPIPSLADAPNGPALCDTAADVILALQTVRARLLKFPNLSLSVDLEGRLGGPRPLIGLAQLCVDAVDDEHPALVYVLDIFAQGPIAVANGLRDLLESPHIVKVMHCFQGDASALQLQYGVVLRCVFDTAIADSLSQSRLPGVKRGLKTVLEAVLGEGVVHMPHKDEMENFAASYGLTHADLWSYRPLPYVAFEYAYQDTTYCNKAYLVLRARLLELDLLDLCFQLSAQQVAQFYKSSFHSFYIPPSRAVYALTDGTRIVTLCSRADQSMSLPSSEIAPPTTLVDRLSLPAGWDPLSMTCLLNGAKRGWATTMGPPVKPLTQAINSHMKPLSRIGDALLVICRIPDCVTVLPLLVASLPDSTSSGHEVVLSSVLDNLPASSGDDKLCLSYLRLHLQQLHQKQHPAAQSPLTPVFDIAPSPRADHSLHTTVTIRISLSLSVSRLASVCATTRVVLSHSHPASAVLLARVPPTRVVAAAIIVHDGTFVYALSGAESNSRLSFPTRLCDGSKDAHPSPEELHNAALLAFETYAGSALLKTSHGTDLMPSFAVMPLAGRFLSDALSFKSCVVLGDFVVSPDGTPKGGALTRYFSASVASLRRFVGTKHEQSGLFALETDFHASRRCGFEATATQLKKFPSWGFYDYSKPSRFGPVDKVVLSVLSSNQFSPVAPLDRPLGSDPAFDTLFESACLVFADALRDSPVASVNTVQPQSVVPAAANNPPSLEEIRIEQSRHPATARIIDWLNLGRLSTAWTGASPAERNELLREPFHLSACGTLLYVNPPSASGGPRSGSQRIVIPPLYQDAVLRLCHDKAGHFGVQKTQDLLLQRFHWGSDTDMRRSASDYIKTCDACQFSKIPHHNSGPAFSPDNGSYPFDVVGVDEFSVGDGRAVDGYASCLDFADYFTRLIVSEPFADSLTSEKVFDILLARVVQVHGCPREIRSDQARVLISAALKHLYESHGISIKFGSAYTHNIVAIVERWHSTLNTMLRTRDVEDKTVKWYKAHPLLVLAFNSATHAVSKYSPFFLNHLRSARLGFDSLFIGDVSLPTELTEFVASRLRERQVVWNAANKSLQLNSLHAKQRLDLARVTDVSFNVGDLVLVQRGSYFDPGAVHAKAEALMDGPYRVVQVLPHNRYSLESLDTSRPLQEPVTGRRCLPYHPKPPPAPAPHLLDDLYAVESLIDRRVVKVSAQLRPLASSPDAKVVEYRVRWLGFSSTYDSWRARSTLTSIQPLLDAYDAKRPLPREFGEPPALAPLDPPTVPPAPPLRLQGRFRFHPSPPTGVSTSSPPPPTFILHDKFPVGTRVEVRARRSRENWILGHWYPGVVTKSWLYVPRDNVDGSLVNWHILVQYDEPRFHKQGVAVPYEHVVSDWDIRKQSHAAQTEDRTAPDRAPLPDVPAPAVSPEPSPAAPAASGNLSARLPRRAASSKVPGVANAHLVTSEFSPEVEQRFSAWPWSSVLLVTNSPQEREFEAFYASLRLPPAQ